MFDVSCVFSVYEDHCTTAFLSCSFVADDVVVVVDFCMGDLFVCVV